MMKPGRELDALIAEKVMGLKVRIGEDYGGYDEYQILAGIGEHEDFGPGEWWVACPSYSTDIPAAWQVVEKLKLTIAPSIYRIGWWAGEDYESYLYDHTHGAETDTAPHAICLAALKAVGHEFKGESK